MSGLEQTEQQSQQQQGLRHMKQQHEHLQEQQCPCSSTGGSCNCMRSSVKSWSKIPSWHDNRVKSGSGSIIFDNDLSNVIEQQSAGVRGLESQTVTNIQAGIVRAIHRVTHLKAGEEARRIRNSFSQRANEPEIRILQGYGKNVEAYFIQKWLQDQG